MIYAAEHFVFFGAAFLTLHGLAQLFIRNKSSFHYVCLFLYLLMAVLLFRRLLDFDNRLERMPHFIRLHLPFMYALGPLLYFYAEHLLGKNRDWSHKTLYHFLPALLGFLINLPVYFRSGPEKLSYYHMETSGFFDVISMFTFWLSVPWAALYLWPVFKEVRELTWGGFKGKGPPLLIAGSFLVSFGVAALLEFVGSFHVVYPFLLNLKLLVGVQLTLAFAGLYFLQHRYPDFLQDLKLEIAGQKYQISHIANMDVQQVDQKLENLLQEGKIYCDEDLTLQRLAHLLGLSTHQLSEFLNVNRKKKFYTLINEYRIAEAQRLLLAEPDRSVLSIGLAVGYNTKSVFYKAFTKYVKISPTAFRKRNQKA